MVVESRIDDLERAMRSEIFQAFKSHAFFAQFAWNFQLLQAGKKARLVSQGCAGVMVGMASFPIWEDHHTWFSSPDHLGDLQAIDPSVFDATIRNIESLSPPDRQQARSFERLAFSIVGGSARS